MAVELSSIPLLIFRVNKLLSMPSKENETLDNFSSKAKISAILKSSKLVSKVFGILNVVGSKVIVGASSTSSTIIVN